MSTSFGLLLDSDDHESARALLARVSEWHRPPGRSYWTAEAPTVEGASRAFFIKIEPRGFVHRHRDTDAVHTTDHIVVETNDRAFNCWADESGEHSEHLALGKRYRVRDRGLGHWAVNDGETDRIHLLIEFS